MDELSVAAIEELEKCGMLDMESCEQIRSWGLRIKVRELVPIAGPENPERDFVPELAAKIRASMVEAPKARSFEFLWEPECISYFMQNETYGKFPEPPEVFTGKLFRRFSWSYLLELSQKTTNASEQWPGPGPIQHFSIACCDDVIDVIACMEPVVRQLP